MRKYAREIAVGFIYQSLLRDNLAEIDFNLFNTDGLTEEDYLYINSTYNGVMANINEIKQIVSQLSIGFAIDRIYKVDLAIIINAIYELRFTDTPAPIIINEAVELGRKLSTDNSIGYINGILGQFYKNFYDTKPEN